MTQVKINDAALQKAALEGMDEFVKVFIDATLEAIGGQLTAQNMAELNSDQITLLAWHFLHEEMMDGGMIQLIHNGFGGFIFRNPTDKAFRNWGIPDLGKLINKAHFFYKKAAAEVEQDMRMRISWRSTRNILNLMTLMMLSSKMRRNGPARWPTISTKTSSSLLL